MAVSASALTNKTELRQRLRAQRRALDAAARRPAAARLAQNLFATRWFRVSRHIGCYLAHDGEIDARAIIKRLRRGRKHCYLPVLSNMRGERLWFAPIGARTKFAANRYGILEPRVPARKRVRARRLDLLLLPLVGFDKAGQRLGMGGGYYDRSLAFLRLRRGWRQPRLVGLAYDFQKLPTLPRADWDVALDAVVTNAAVYSMPTAELENES